MKIATALLIVFTLSYLPTYSIECSPEMSMKFDTPYFLDNFEKYPADTLFLVGVIGKPGINPAIKFLSGERYVSRTKSTFTAFVKPATIVEIAKNENVINISSSFQYKTGSEHNPNYVYKPLKVNSDFPRRYGLRRSGMDDFLNDPKLKSYDGRGVIVGIIESGLVDFRHPDFLNPDGSTRFLAIWDQQDDAVETNSAFGYGKVWSPKELNEIISGKSDALVNFGENSWHITNSACVSAGNGFATGDYCGVAPQASIVQVDIPTSDRVNLIDACRFIFNLADSLNMPCVISVSQAMQALSQDGSDIASVAISEMVREKPGRIVFSSAGNNGPFKNHLRYEGKQGAEKFFWSMPVKRYRYVSLKIKSSEIQDLEFALAIDSIQDSFKYISPHKWIKAADCLEYPGKRYNIENSKSIKADAIIRPSNLTDSTTLFMIRIESADASLNESPNALRIAMRGGGVIDVWTPLSNYICEGYEHSDKTLPENYLMPDNQYMISSIACARDVMAVGAFYNQIEFKGINGEMLNSCTEEDSSGKSGEPCYWTQQGGNLSGFWKPDFLSPGQGVGSVFPLDMDRKANYAQILDDGMHMIYGGTSAASPVAAGMGALFLQKNPTATFEDFRTAVRETADVDETTGPVPNAKCGYGKINLYKLMKWEKKKGE